MKPLSSSLTVSSDGFIHIVMPKNLLAGNSAQKAANDTINLDGSKFWSNYIANSDGTATILCAKSQYVNYKNFTFYIYVEELHVLVSTSIFAKTYNDNMMKRITIICY